MSGSTQLLIAQIDGPALLLWPIFLRLILAAFLGGIIGLEREMKQRPAGLRTQMFICVGSAFFTVLSTELASFWGGDHTRIAAQIIPGIGFIGAGSILHSRRMVVGLTTAATVFVVASIGMAAGGGFYLLATCATVLVLAALLLLGWMEERLRLKAVPAVYVVVGAETDIAVNEVNRVLAEQSQVMQSVDVSKSEHAARIQFSVEGTRREHDILLQQLRRSAVFQRVEYLGAAERE